MTSIKKDTAEKSLMKKIQRRTNVKLPSYDGLSHPYNQSNQLLSDWCVELLDVEKLERKARWKAQPGGDIVGGIDEKAFTGSFDRDYLVMCFQSIKG